MNKDNIKAIKLRIRALMNMTVANGCTEAEAMEAMFKASELLTKYNLSMNDVEMAEEASTLKQTQYNYPEGVQYVGWSLLCSIAQFCDCKVWYLWTAKSVATRTGIKRGRNRTSRTIHSCVFFGFETDTQMACYLYQMLQATIKTEIACFKKTSIYLSTVSSRKSLTTSFEHGINNRLAQRLQMLLAERKNKQQFGSKALVIVKTDLIEQEFVALKANLKTVSGAVTVTRNKDAFEAGQKAADRVNLNRPLEAKKDSVLIK